MASCVLMSRNHPSHTVSTLWLHMFLCTSAKAGENIQTFKTQAIATKASATFTFWYVDYGLQHVIGNTPCDLLGPSWLVTTRKLMFQFPVV